MNVFTSLDVEKTKHEMRQSESSPIGAQLQIPFPSSSMCKNDRSHDEASTEKTTIKAHIWSDRFVAQYDQS